MTPEAKKFTSSFYRNNLNIRIWNKDKNTCNEIVSYIKRH